uniref:Uncharacterized protein n=1 Tax=Wuchereria bancrofti TaxID=6293 RepID=A0AAF5Q5H0_WUCBA
MKTKNLPNSYERIFSTSRKRDWNNQKKHYDTMNICVFVIWLNICLKNFNLGPCSDDNHCLPNLYCVNSSCWYLSNKPIRIQRKHDASPVILKYRFKFINFFLNSLMNTKEQDRSHLAIHHQLSRSVGTVTRNDELFFQRILPKIETMTRNLSKFENLDLFDYTTSNTFRYCKMTNGNYREEQKELIPTNNSTDGDNFSKSSFIDLRFLTELPVQTEYIRKRKFALNYILLEVSTEVIKFEMVCCRKTCYDLNDHSETGCFCLPNYEFTKKVSLGIHEANGLTPNNIIYDWYIC